MAQYNGYVNVAHGTYQEWRDATLGNGYNVDGAYGNQCWDFCALLWWQYGLRLITRPGGNGTAEDCWLISRDANAVPPFIAVYGVENIKRGDVVVFQGTTSYPTGHIAFADQDYADRVNNRLNFLGQNQGQGSSNPSNIANLPLTNFLGIFRNTNWQQPEPEPEEEKKKRKFPWVVAWSHWQNFKRY